MLDKKLYAASRRRDFCFLLTVLITHENFDQETRFCQELPPCLKTMFVINLVCDEGINPEPSWVKNSLRHLLVAFDLIRLLEKVEFTFFKVIYFYRKKSNTNNSF